MKTLFAASPYLFVTLGMVKGNVYEVSPPYHRFSLWSSRSAQYRSDAAVLGYTVRNWETPGSFNRIEELAYVDLDRNLGFTGYGVPASVNPIDQVKLLDFNSDDQWDCWINHFEGYSWAELDLYGISVHFEALGWDENAWDGNNPNNFPDSEDTEWAGLSSSEKAAAEQLCYFQELWDEESFSDWVGISSFFTDPDPFATPAPSVFPSSSPSDSRAPSVLPSSSPPDSRAPTAAPVPGLGPFCFPGSALVQVEGKGAVPVSEVRLGEKVLTENGLSEEIYSFGHYDPHSKHSFVELLTKSKKSLTLSASHMVMIVNQGAVPASLVKVGDALLHVTGTFDPVISISAVTHKGMFAPFTASGKLVVNGFVVSNYVALQESSFLVIGGYETPFTHQWLAHAFNAPHRFFCGYISTCLDETYTKEGLSVWVALPLRVITWVLRQHSLTVAFISIPLLLALAVFCLLDLPVLLFVIGASFCYVLRKVPKN